MARRHSRADQSLSEDDKLQLFLEFKLGIPNVDEIEFFPRIKGFNDGQATECGVLVFRQRRVGSVMRLYYN